MASEETITKTYSEAAVTINIPDLNKSNERLKLLNEKLRLFREIALVTLKLEIDSADSESVKYCFDAVAATGIAGIQWKKHLGEKVIVTCGDGYDSYIQDSCCLNNITAKDWNRVDSTQRKEETQQGTDQIFVSSIPTKALLHLESFDFVYLHIQGNLVLYLDPLFSNIRSGAIACLLCPNVSSQCFRSPKLIQRQFHAYTQKTVYVSELAARIIAADIVRTAGRHGRAVDILCTLCVDNHFMFVVKVKKGSQLAENSADKCRPVLHCLMCEERVVYPETHCPVEMPYSLLPCDCKNKNPGKTAIILGPLWLGSIYDVPYLLKLMERMKTDFPKSEVNTLLQSVITEAICDKSLYTKNLSTVTKTINSVEKDTGEKCVKKQNSDNQSDIESAEPASKRPKLDNQSEATLKDAGTDITAHSEAGDLIGRGDGNDESKRYEEMPLFYYHLHQQRYSIVPRAETLVYKLKEAGFRASRTHFETHSIRTNANQKQIQAIIETTTFTKTKT